jgi:hypothetical protein
MALILDSQLLLLYVVGATSREYIARHKRLRAYTASDFDLLLTQLDGYSTLLLTPNTLTEASNLIDHIGEPARGRIYGVLKALLSRPEIAEQHLPARRVAEQAELPRLGLTDCTLLQLCADGTPLLTADLALYLCAAARSPHAFNFNHLRDGQ